MLRDVSYMRSELNGARDCPNRSKWLPLREMVLLGLQEKVLYLLVNTDPVNIGRHIGKMR